MVQDLKQNRRCVMNVWIKSCLSLIVLCLVMGPLYAGSERPEAKSEAEQLKYEIEDLEKEMRFKQQRIAREQSEFGADIQSSRDRDRNKDKISKLNMEIGDMQQAVRAKRAALDAMGAGEMTKIPEKPKSPPKPYEIPNLPRS